MIQKKIDIILPTYNGAKYIKEQVESILNQDFDGDFRLIIRDDGSKDNTSNIIDTYSDDKRVRIIKDNKGNLGLVKSIELLLENSDADYIFFSDQDDVWFPNKIKKFLEVVNSENENLLLIHSDCIVTDSNLINKCRFKGDIPNKGLSYALFHFFVQGASSMITKELKNKILPFPKDVYLHDRYIHLMTEILGKRVYINEPTMYYRQHEDNLVGSNGIMKKIKNNIKIKSFFLKEDKKLIENLPYKNKIIDDYLKITYKNTSFIEKIKLINKNKIEFRLKEKILFIINNILWIE